MSNEPTPEDKARYEAIRKELLQALPKKRAVDKQLVRLRDSKLQQCSCN
jgi:chromatin modification-related protein EAF6